MKDDLHVTAEATHLSVTGREQVTTLKHYASRGRLNQTQHQAAESALARSRLADQAEGFARLNIQRHIIDGADFACGASAKDGFAEREDLGQIADFEQGHHGYQLSKTRLLARSSTIPSRC